MPDAGPTDSSPQTDQPPRVVLTRPADRQQALANQLTRAGCEVLSLPALTITPIKPIELKSIKIGSPTGFADWDPRQFDVLVFVSRAAWQFYWQCYLCGQWPGSHSIGAHPSVPILACVGVATARQIALDLGMDLSAITYPGAGLSSDSEGLWAALKPMIKSLLDSPARQGLCAPTLPDADLVKPKVLLIRGQTGRDWLAETLVKHGAAVNCLAVYERQAAVWSPQQVQLLHQWASQQHHTGTWLITSGEGLTAIAAQFDALELTGKPGLQPRSVLVVHERLVAPVSQWLAHWSVAGQSNTVAVQVAPPVDDAIVQGLLGLASE